MLSATANDGDACNAISYEMTFYGETEARFKTLREVQRALAINTPWYNSSPDRPQWGSIDPQTLTIEDVTETVTTSTRSYPAARICLPTWKKGFMLADILSPLTFNEDPVRIKPSHRVVIKKDGSDVDPSSLVGREFFLGDRRVCGIANVTYAGAPALLVEVDV